MAKYDFWIVDYNTGNVVLEETIEDVYSIGKMDDYYILEDADGNQFIRDLKRYARVDMWVDDYDIHDDSDEDLTTNEFNTLKNENNNVIDLFKKVS